MLGGVNGIDVESARRVKIDNVRVVGAQLDGIHVRFGQVMIQRLRRRLAGPFAQGVDISYSMSEGMSSVEGCDVSGGSEGIVTHDSMVMVGGNRVHGTSLRGITMSEMSMGEVAENNVTGARGVGVYCGDHSECEIRQNVVAGTRSDGTDNLAQAGVGIELNYYAFAYLDRNVLVGNPKPVVGVRQQPIQGFDACRLQQAVLRALAIPTEPIGSIPRPAELQEGMQAFAAGSISEADLDALYDDAVRDTVSRFEATGSPVITDGEQRKPSFVTYPIAGLEALAPEGVTIPFADGHTRRLPVLTAGPFRYATHAATYLDRARPYTSRPLKQAVISASALSLLYPQDGIDGYPQDAFVADLLDQAEIDIRGCFEAGADSVQIDFTEGRLALKLDPSGGVLNAFVDLNNRLLERFSRRRARADRRPHLPRRRPRLDSQRRRRLRRAPAGALPPRGRPLLPSARERGRPPEGPAGGRRPLARRAEDLRRRDRPDRPEGRVGRGGARPRARGRALHPARPPRNDRRLRLLAVRRRHLDRPRHRVREDPGPDQRHQARRGRARDLAARR